MFSYILQVTLCWSAFYLLYLGLLRKETFFHINRWYLLGTLVIGLLIPFVEWQPSSVIEDHPTYEIAIEPIQLQMGQLEQSIEAASQSSILDWTDICLAIYLSGMLFFIALLLHGLWKIWKLYRAGEVEQQGQIKVVYTTESHLPFSFFNYLFWSKHFEAEHQEKAQILRHEEAHIHQWHTLDVLFLELLNILFWCSPIIYFYRKSLRTTHEYLADALVLQDTKRKEYGHLLLKQSLSGIQIALANHFIHSQLKNRILMMTRNKSRKRNLMKYLPFLPILLLAILVFSKHDGRVQVEKAVASLMQVEKQPFDEKEITEALREMASAYATFTEKDMKDNGRFVNFASDYKELMGTYDKSEREIAELTQAIFLQYDIVVEPSVDALTKVARISFLNSNGASGKFTLFFDDDFGLTNTEITSIEKRLYELAETHQRFGCCDANPDAPYEQFSADYIKFLSSFGDTQQKLQVAHLTEEIFKENSIEVDLNLVDVNGDKNYVLSEISFKTDDLINGGSARKFTYHVNDQKEQKNNWEVTFTQYMKMYIKKYELASSDEEQQEAMSAFEKEHQRWLGMYPDKAERINEIVEEVKELRLYHKEQLDYKGFLPYYEKVLQAKNAQQQADAVQQLADYTDDLYDENSHDYNKVLNAAYRGAYEALGDEGMPIEFRTDSKKRIILYWMAGVVDLTTYHHENDPRHLKEYEADFVIVHRLDPSSRDENRTLDYRLPKKHNKNWANYSILTYGRRKNITDDHPKYHSFVDGWEDRFSYTNDRVQAKFASTFREEKVNSRFIHPIKDPSKITREMGYGMRIHPIFKKRQMHTGVDYVVPMNTEIVATADGKVVAVKNWQKGYGLHISVEHENGYATFYAHLEKSLVKVGQSVKQGEVIALSGNTGTSTGPHLHYEVRKNGEAIDFEAKEITKAKGSLEKRQHQDNLEINVVASGNKKAIQKGTLIEMNFTPDLSEQKLERIQEELKEKGITLSFEEMRHDKQGDLVYLSYKMSNDSGSEMSQSGDPREDDNFGFYTFYDTGALGTLPVDEEDEPYNEVEKNSILDVDEMPRFPSKECEALKSIEAKRNCSTQALIKYIYTNIKYPAEARKTGIEGQCLLRFKVMQDGSLDDIRLLKDIGAGCGEEAKRVIEKMNEDNLRWIPGKKDGKNVVAEFTIPVNFKLTDDPPKTEREELFKVVEQMPRFPSERCEQIATNEEKRKCSSGALMEYLFKNIKYTKAAKEVGKEGMCVVQFVVEKDGSLSEIELLRDIGYGLGEESKRVVEKMNEDGLRWIAGMQRGRKVRVQFNLPIRFALTDDAKKTSTKEFDPTPELASQKLTLMAFNVAPNPSNGELRLRFEGIAKPLTIKVYDSNGKMLFEEQVQNFDGNFDQQIQVKGSAGIHFLTIEQEGKVFVEQLVIE